MKQNKNGDRPADIASYLGLLPITVQTTLKNDNKGRADGMAWQDVPFGYRSPCCRHVQSGRDGRSESGDRGSS